MVVCLIVEDADAATVLIFGEDRLVSASDEEFMTDLGVIDHPSILLISVVVEGDSGLGFDELDE